MGKVKEPKPSIFGLCDEIIEAKPYRRIVQAAFAISFKLERTKSGLTQPALAKLLGISPQYLSDLENDRRLPSAEVAAKIRAWAEGTG